MRLWHYKILPELGNKLLTSQYREALMIYYNWDGKRVNNKIINRVYDYSKEELKIYIALVISECDKRGFKLNKAKSDEFRLDTIPDNIKIFKDWHDSRYYEQCYYILQEKKDCGIN